MQSAWQNTRRLQEVTKHLQAGQFRLASQLPEQPAAQRMIPAKYSAKLY
jgi:hypothetical protein